MCVRTRGERVREGNVVACPRSMSYGSSFLLLRADVSCCLRMALTNLAALFSSRERLSMAWMPNSHTHSLRMRMLPHLIHRLARTWHLPCASGEWAHHPRATWRQYSLPRLRRPARLSQIPSHRCAYSWA